MKKNTFFVITLILILTVASTAQEKHSFTVEDLWKVKRVSGPVMSPDGKWLAVTVAAYNMEENKGQSDLWLIATDGSETKQLTTNPKSDSSPAWSPDSQQIAFVSGRAEGASQLFLININGGEAKQITNISTGAGGHKWSPDGSKLYFISSVWPDCADDESNRKKSEELKNSKVKAHVVDKPLFRHWMRWVNDGRLPMLFEMDLESEETTNLFLNKDFHFSVTGAGSGNYDISPDGTEIAFSFDTARNPGQDSNDDIYLLSLETGEITNITVENKSGDSSPVYSPDGKYIAYSKSKESLMIPDYSRIAIYNRESKDFSVLTEDFESSAGGKSWGNNSDRIYFTAGVRGRAPIFSVAISGGAIKKHFDGNTMSSLNVSPDEQVFYFARQTFSFPQTIFRANADGSEELQLSTFNDELLAQINWHSVEDHTFTGADGDEVHMFVLKPYDFDPNKKYALVHLLHGGPHGAWNESFHIRWNAQLFAAPGYVVTAMNFHGSSTYGQKFFDSIAGAEGDKPFEDTMKATDYMLGLGYIDETKMAAGGGSYGGYLANWVATQTDRFAALFSHAGGFNHHGMFASDTPRFRERRWGGYPWENLPAVDRQSPNRFAKDIKTPMLITHGELDYRVVVTQGLEAYNTLQIMGVPSKLVYFPDEGHWIAKPQNARLWWNEIHAWLKEYIGPEE